MGWEKQRRKQSSVPNSRLIAAIVATEATEQCSQLDGE